MSEATTVKVGGNERVLARFRSYKVTLALDILKGVTDEVRGLFGVVAEERRKYAAANPVRITRQMCMERSSELTQIAEQARREAAKETDAEKLQGFEDQAAVLEARAQMYERQLEDMGDKDFIEQPGQLPQDQEILVALPEALKMRKQFTQLIGLALIDDAQLKDAWITEDVFDTIEKHGQDMLFEMELGEEVELIAAVHSMIEAQLRPRKGAIENLRGLRDLWTGGTKELEEKTAKEENGNGSTPETDDSPTSSTPSAERTDGQSDRSSSLATEPSPTT